LYIAGTGDSLHLANVQSARLEVWEILGAVKTEFGKFGDVLVLAKTKKKLDEASNSIEMAERRTRLMARELRTVEALPEAVAQQRFGGAVVGAGRRGDGGDLRAIWAKSV